MPERVETVIIGGGQAGLAMSHHLSRLGREHIVHAALAAGRLADDFVATAGKLAGFRGGGSGFEDGPRPRAPRREG